MLDGIIVGIVCLLHTTVNRGCTAMHIISRRYLTATSEQILEEFPLNYLKNVSIFRHYSTTQQRQQNSSNEA